MRVGLKSQWWLRSQLGDVRQLVQGSPFVVGRDLPSGPVLRARRKIAWGDRKTGARARICTTYGRSVRAGGVPFTRLFGPRRKFLYS